MKKIRLLILLLSVLLAATSFAQKQTVVKTVKQGQITWYFQKPVYHDLSAPLDQLIKNAKPPKYTRGIDQEEAIEKAIEKYLEQKLKGKAINEPDPLSKLQKRFNPKTSPLAIKLLASFEGAKNSDNSSQVAPPDTQGDVNQDYYMQCVNNVTTIFDRNGNIVKGPFPTSDFWSGTGYDDRNDGDAVILWDEQDQRWIVTQFYLDPNNESILIAVSKTSDPTGQYYRYAYQFNYMPDYPKFAVWSDGLYMGANGFDQNNSDQYVGPYVAAFQLSEMLNGGSALALKGLLSDTLFSVFPTDADVTPSSNLGGCFFVTDELNSYTGNKHVYIFQVNVNWSDTSGSITLNSNIEVAPYDLFQSEASVPQPNDQKLDLLQSRIMYRAYFRPFSDHNSLLVCRTVNDNGVSAIRWYEFRNTNSNPTWQLYQQGTYNPGDGNWRWMPSIAMNAKGDISIGYSISNTDLYPSIALVGRKANDPLGVMTSYELIAFHGTGAQDTYSRWGDYSMVSIDPDDSTFWFTTEYTTGGLNWHTRILHYDFCTPPAQATNFQVVSTDKYNITISWTRGGGDSVLVVCRKDAPVNSYPSNGQIYEANPQFGQGSQIGQGNFVVYKGTGNQVTITHLIPGSTYYFAIYEFNGDDHCYNPQALTGQATTAGQTPSYCYSYGNTDFYTSVTGVVFNTINNSTAKTTDDNGNAYNDYTYLSTDVYKNNSYNLTVRVNTDGNYTVYAMAWIDWNQDGDFNDPGETYNLGSATNTDDGNTNNSPLTITVPSNAKLGYTRMRVSAKYDTAASACEQGFDGEVEDYSILVRAVPTITQQPQDIETCLGNSATFSVTANDATSYQWYHNNNPISGATNSTLTINSVSSSDTGAYYCKIFNDFDSTVSNIARLTIAPDPVITSQSGDQTVNEGDNVQLTVSAQNATSYQWKKDGNPLSDNGHFSGTTTNSLQISNVTSSDAGQYTCTVSGQCNSVESQPIQLTVNASSNNLPVITQQPQDQTVCQGSSATFSISAQNATAYQWFKDNSPINGATNPQLNIDNADLNDAGQYFCKVSNQYGDVYSDTVTLTVNPLTQITSQSGDMTAELGDNIQMSVTAENATVYQWKKDGNLLSDDGHFTGTNTNILQIHNVTQSDAGTYVCIVSGQCNIVESQPIQLVVQVTYVDKQMKNVRIYPNPANNQITVKFAQAVSNATVTITDELGHTLYKTNFSGDRLQIDVSSFSQGLYFITIENNQANLKAKLIVR